MGMQQNLIVVRKSDLKNFQDKSFAIYSRIIQTLLQKIKKIQVGLCKILMINFDTNHPKQSYTFTKNSANSEYVEENAKKIISHLYGPTTVVCPQ